MPRHYKSVKDDNVSCLALAIVTVGAMILFGMLCSFLYNVGWRIAEALISAL